MAKPGKGARANGAEKPCILSLYASRRSGFGVLRIAAWLG
jgi:hypothetical protein